MSDASGVDGRGAVFGVMVLVAALLACAHADEYNQKTKADLLRRAEFDMQCARLQTKVLQRTTDDIITSYGVVGCGKRATYVLTPTGSWLMNSATDPKAQTKPGE